MIFVSKVNPQCDLGAAAVPAASTGAGNDEFPFSSARGLLILHDLIICNDNQPTSVYGCLLGQPSPTCDPAPDHISGDLDGFKMPYPEELMCACGHGCHFGSTGPGTMLWAGGDGSRRVGSS